MDTKNQVNEIHNVSHLTILITYTLFSVVLLGEAILLSWELWFLPLVVIGVLAAWAMHFMQFMSEHYRLWLYCVLMMVTLFYYGIHKTSIYDLAPVVGIVIMIFSMTGEAGLVYLAMAAYYLTMFYHLVATVLVIRPKLEPLIVTRTLLHLLLVLMAGRIAIVTITKWAREQKKYNKQIMHLEEENKRTEDFLANVSHELRTPINAVTGLTSVILTKETDSDIKKDVFSVQRAGYRLVEQIGDILDYTEIDTGRLKLSQETYMVTSLITDVVAEYKLVRDVPCELILDIDAQLPAGLSGDVGKMKRLLQHLITNGIKFTSKGGVYVRLYALEKPYGINLCIEVSDTGIGMETNEIGKIREKFYQTDSGRSRMAGGLGLGLPIVYGLTKAMGGFIRIESKKGYGTIVHVSIPQKVEDASPCMVVEKRESVCLACYIRAEKYELPKVRDYYNRMLANMQRTLNIPLHTVSSKEELIRLQRIYQLTHLLIGEEEYKEDRGFFEAFLQDKIEVIVVAGDDFALPESSPIHILRKPLYSFPIVNLLNFAKEEEKDGLLEETRIYCPGIRALVVDDESMNLMVAEGIFRDYGMYVMTAGSGMEALEICEKEEFDLIFMDHMMPQMDGVETMKRLRLGHKEKQLTVIALTANAVSGAKDMFLAEGFDGFVAKPIEPRALERVLKKLLPKSAITYERPEKNEKSDGIGEEGTVLPTAGPDMHTQLFQIGIKAREGIRYCKNDESFYQELLLKFAEEAEAKMREIRSFYEGEDWENYRIRVHALKSTSKMIGAYALSDLAKTQEEAAKIGDMANHQSDAKALLSMYGKIAEGISILLGQEEKSLEKAETGMDQDDLEISEEALLNLLEELAGSLKTFEANRAEEMLEVLSGYCYHGTRVADSLKKVKALVEEFDMQSALADTEKLTAALKSGTFDKGGSVT